MPLRKILPFLPLVFFGLIIAAAMLLLLSGKDPKKIETPLLSRALPVLEMDTFEKGEKFKTSTLKGRVTLLNIFASWCLPCKAEHPQLLTLRDEVEIYGLNYKDTKKAAQKWLRDRGNPYQKIGIDPSGRHAITLGVYGAPETYIIDSKGYIRYKHTGPIMPQDLDKIRAIIKDISP